MSLSDSHSVCHAVRPWNLRGDVSTVSPQHHETPLAAKRAAQEQLLARELALVPAAGRLEGRARAVDEAARGEVHPAHGAGDKRDRDVRVARRIRLEHGLRASAHRAGIECGHRRAQHLGIHPGVGIHEDQPVAARRRGAVIAGLRDLAVGDRDHARAGGRGDNRRRIGGCVVGHHDLVVEGEAIRLVVCRDDEGDQSPSVAM